MVVISPVHQQLTFNDAQAIQLHTAAFLDL